MIVIGITGRNCAGKDTFADMLEEQGFERHSLSDVLRVELRRRGVEITRTALIALGRELRESEGPAVLAQRVKDMITTDRVALVSVRSPLEVDVLRQMPGFTLVTVEAPVDIRFERERARDREGSVDTLEEFRALENLEESSSRNAQQLGATIALADHVLPNAGPLVETRARVSALLAALGA